MEGNKERALFVANVSDNVATSLFAFTPCDVKTYGDKEENITLLQDIPRGYKVALCSIPKGEQVVKYGVPIGVATQDIARGEKVHLNNCASNYDARSSELDPETADRTINYDL